MIENVIEYLINNVSNSFFTILSILPALLGIIVLTKYLQKNDIETSISNQNFHIKIKDKNLNTNIFSEDEKKEIIKKIKQNILEEANKNILEDIKKQLKEDKTAELIKNQFDNTISRLKEELFSLSKRGNLNLSIGIITTLMGLILLGSFIMQNNIDLKNSEHFFINFIPRISLVILIEIFAYFFLKLYKNNISEIKYFQNEITTIETKLLALQIAIELKENSIINEAITNLLQSERNFILNKGQTTVDIEKNKIELQSTNSILDKITSIINKKS